MTRSVVALAIHSGIPTEVWLAGDPRVLYTAFDVLDEQAKAAGGKNKRRLAGS